MSLAMVRIDDRLLHGQVVVGWCPFLKPDRVIVCDNDAAANEWECELYQDAAGEYATSIYGIEKAADVLKETETKDEKIFLVVASPQVIVRLMNSGVKIRKVIVGGMHYQAGKRKISNFIYVDDEDLRDFRFLVDHNVVLEGKDLPHGKTIDLGKRLHLN
ncbi:MAG: PTS system mannose/fructose/N-acetylgalactosamine-transporter subunit IIB [bacterium]